VLEQLHFGLGRLDGTEAADGDFLLNPSAHAAMMQQTYRDAAVLIAVTDEAEPNVILTRRSENLRKHTGQVAFPGGAIDAGDASAEAAACREAEEEIGLPRSLPTIIGKMPDYLAGSGFRIKPIVALIPAAQPLTINADEVAEAFEVPLSFLLNPDNHHRASRMWNGIERHYFEMPYQQHRIWGVTAGIIHALYRRVAA
jgi:8-oxo-dGTP pyrophosphatase MutT (NUDIX family)